MKEQLRKNLAFEKAVRLLTDHFTESDVSDRKPRLFHVIRVGTYLYTHNYSYNIVIAGVLHDALEWSEINESLIEEKFGTEILELVKANSKDDTITDSHEKVKELIQRCALQGEDALIIKVADILDSFSWYETQQNEGELLYCIRNANAIFEYKPENFNDKIFDELKTWQNKYSSLQAN